jgi:hypothetical protein
MDTLIALTSEQIQERKKELKRHNLLFKIWGILFMFSCPCAFVSFFLSGVIGGMDGFIVFGVLATMAALSWINMEYHSRDDTDCEILSRSQCEEMMKLINSVPEGKAFQKAILAQNRQFIQQDLMDIRQWKETASERHACKQLYEIA